MTTQSHISAPPDVSEVVARVLDDLAARRWSHLAEPVGVEVFEAILAGLGAVVSRYDVFVSPERERTQRAARRNNITRPSLFQATEMGFHTDPGGIDLLAFYCAAQDETEGANLLIDLGDLDRHFDADEIDAMGCIPVSYPVINADGVDELHHLPLVSRRRAACSSTTSPGASCAPPTRRSLGCWGRSRSTWQVAPSGRCGSGRASA